MRTEEEKKKHIITTATAYEPIDAGSKKGMESVRKPCMTS